MKKFEQGEKVSECKIVGAFINLCIPSISPEAMVKFKLIAENMPSLFLHLFNCHNGYYGHGFEAKIGDETWKEGTL